MATIFRIALADFMERVRRTGFLVAILLTILLGCMFSPPSDGGYVTLVFDRYVGVYNSAWMGMSVAISTIVFFSLIGFYLVANAIGLDARSGVGQLVAASSVGRTKYVLGKYFSNLAILGVIVMLLMVMAFIMQLMRGESTAIHIWELVSPFLLLVLPLMALVAAAAIWFEIVPWLRGTVGTVVYFVIWISSIFLSRKPIPLGHYLTLSDPYGQKIPIDSIAQVVHKQFPDYNGNISQGLTLLEEPVRKFVWEGIDWTAPLVAGRLLWVFVAFALAGTAAIFFRGFRDERAITMQVNKTRTEAGAGNVSDVGEAFISGMALDSVQVKAAFLPVLRAELRLMFSGLRWWLFGACSLLILGFVLSPDASTRFVLPLVWIWPLALWSAMGSREIRFETEDLLYSSPFGARWLLTATWLSGILVALLTSLGIGMRLLASGEWEPLLAWLVAAVFIPTFALVCGVWSQNRRTFEILYLALWFLGPLNRMPIFNFMDLRDSRQPFIYSAAAVLLYVAAVIGRKAKMNR
ncbi:hypothetical protein C8Z91_11545 [Paenibacillus elgii]|uniref:Uncharacterized protein n=1 Tax=Paenibacillus elgii TaxID=189691 RepID=A0A2T6G4K6_9BACL|nr:hypothetical protein [Paenibacillus elgii]PUA39096.1 hypothetical protein C8Z91_11545 [Paenibacillus elgii]